MGSMGRHEPGSLGGCFCKEKEAGLLRATGWVGMRMWGCRLGVSRGGH